MKFGNYQTLQKVAGKNFLKSSNILLIIKLLALTSLIVGISQPVLEQNVSRSNSDYIIALDSSSSMLASDIEPNRFEAAKQASMKFVDSVSNSTKVGIVSFAGGVSKESELTDQKAVLKKRIDNVKIGKKAGTAIGDSLYTSSSLLLDSNRSKTVILITDGRNNVGSSLNESLEFAKRGNITINTVGIGDTGRSTSDYGIVEGENATRARYPNLNTEKLFNLSKATGGKLNTVSSSDDFENAFIELEETTVEKDLSRYFIYLAVFLILIEWALGTTKYSIMP